MKEKFTLPENTFNSEIGIIGQALIFDTKQNKNVVALISKVDDEYRLYLSEDEEILGKIQLNKVLRIHPFKDDKVYSEMDDVRINSSVEAAKYSGKHNRKKALPKIYIESLDSYNPRYAGVGTALIQAAVETSFLQQCVGRVALYAAFDSHVFYYKMHFRAQKGSGISKVNLLLEQLCYYQDFFGARLKTSKFFENNMGLLGMDIPEKFLKKWDEKIQKSPILHQTNKIRSTLFYSKEAGLLMGIKNDLHLDEGCTYEMK